MKVNLRERMDNARRRLRYRWWRFKRLPLRVLGGLLGMAVISSIVGLWGTEECWKGLLANLGTELVGAGEG